MELRHYLTVLRRRLVFILLVVFLAIAAAAIATPKQHRYTATSVIYVGATKFAVTPNSAYSYDPTQLVERLMKTYATMLDSEPIATAAITGTGVQRSSKKVVDEAVVTPGTDTQLLTVAVTDPDPAVAQKLTNGLADAFMSRVKSQDAQPTEGSLPSLPAYVFQRADLPDEPNGTGLLRNMLLAGFFGLLVSVGIALLLDHLDDTLRTSTAAEAQLHLPVMAFLPYNSGFAAGVRTVVAQVAPLHPRARPAPQPQSRPRIGA